MGAIAVTLALLVACAALLVGSNWSSLAHLHGAIIAAAVSLATTLIGIFVIAYQIRTQAAFAVRANTANEAMKLKAKIYEEILSTCEKETRAAAALIGYLEGFRLHAAMAHEIRKSGVSSPQPAQRYETLVSMKREHALAANAIVKLTQEWEIADPRVDVFRAALKIRLMELSEAFQNYIEHVVLTMPNDATSAPGAWSNPHQDMKELEARTRAAINAVEFIGLYIDDYRVEMQNALLGDLFKGNAAAVRAPEDPAYRPIRLSDRDALMEIFEQHKHWGGARRTAPRPPPVKP